MGHPRPLLVATGGSRGVMHPTARPQSPGWAPAGPLGLASAWMLGR